MILISISNFCLHCVISTKIIKNNSRNYEGGDFTESCLTLTLINIYDAVIGIISKYATISTGLLRSPDNHSIRIYLTMIVVTGTISEKYASR